MKFRRSYSSNHTQKNAQNSLQRLCDAPGYFEKLQTVKLQRVYNRIAHAYDKRETIIEILMLKKLRHGHFSRASGLILDVAAGTGKNLPHFPHGTEVVGIDLSSNMLLRARKKSERLGHSHFAVMDAQRLGFRDESFDTVTSSLSMCTVPDPVKALKEMGRVVKPNRKILLLEHGLSKIPWVARLQHVSTPVSVERVGCHPDRDHTANILTAGLDLTRSRTRLLDIVKLIEASKKNQTTANVRS